ncbi:MAG: SIS domain-containing protein [Deltaproteobacteria bacterium]|nr:SIS domain-containing protein [Deltaproteobacteria bacterium]
MEKRAGCLFKLILGWLGSWFLYLGRDPEGIDSKAIIIFPLCTRILCCGLAGIITIKRPKKTPELPVDLPSLVERARRRGIRHVLNGSIKSVDYLGGRLTLDAIESAINRYRSDETFIDILGDNEALKILEKTATVLKGIAAEEESAIEREAPGMSTSLLEQVTSFLERIKDAAWSLDQDILAAAEESSKIACAGCCELLSHATRLRYRKINFLINALDRLEVRGRDSLGIQVTLSFEGQEPFRRFKDVLKEKKLDGEFLGRSIPQDLMDGTIQTGETSGGGPCLSFFYKKAAVTGRLGENGLYLRERIQSDAILSCALQSDDASEVYIGHTRWASVGSIIEENCHPINNFTLPTETADATVQREISRSYPAYGAGEWHINVSLNGDVDNYLPLRKALERADYGTINHRVTTDTKIIPLQIERYLNEGCDLLESFRRALNDFEGSHAIAMQSNLEPGKVFLAQRGSGQALYVGLCEDQYIFSSEVYGLVERTRWFIKMDGERERVAGDPATKGQIVVLDEDANDALEDIKAYSYDGSFWKLGKDDIKRAEITTRDIDRKGYPHFLLKEITEAPLSVKKTLLGKCRIIQDHSGAQEVVFNIGDDIISPRLLKALKAGQIKTIYVVGQGTAAVAGAGIAEVLTHCIGGLPIKVEARKATDLSGFFISNDMSDTIVIAVTQSGTTTDTNRAVAMAKGRGAHLIAIVNRRQSDITHKVDGVFYTSDGRDIEMSVASTKAFYSQLVAGSILSLFFAKRLGTMKDGAIAETIRVLDGLPSVMNRVIERRESIKASVWDLVKRKIYWAVVGSGPNKIASDEIRIKLSELCYKTVSSDVIEDKKHIDLSSEPLILVCAAGNPETVTEDIVKDAAIFKAHAASVVVIAEEGERRFDDVSDAVIAVPPTGFPGYVIVNTLAGHLVGYYAACSISEEAEMFRLFRTVLANRLAACDEKNFSLFDVIADTDLHREVGDFEECFRERKNHGKFANMSVDAATDLVILLRYATGKLPLEDFWREFEGRRISSSPLDMLDLILGKAVDELTRPVDAIRHQAKTVTVGTSRKEEQLEGILFDLMKDLDFSLENLTVKDGLAIRRLQGALLEVQGYTLYRIADLNDEGMPAEATTIAILRKEGIAAAMDSRADTSKILSGTKRSIIESGDVYAGLGRSDNRPIVIIPLRGRDCHIAHILLVHVNFRDRFDGETARAILGDKWNALRNLVNEYNLQWEDRYLEELPPAYLLGESVDRIAGRILEGTANRQKA